jgi:hypothetical protein
MCLSRYLAHGINMKKRTSGIGSLLLLTALTALGVAGCAVEPSGLDNSVAPAPSEELAARGTPGVSADEALTADEQALNDVQEKLRPVADSVESSFLTDPDFTNISMDAAKNTVIVYREGGETAAARLRLPATNPVGASVQIRAALLGKARVETRPRCKPRGSRSSPGVPTARADRSASA